MAALTQLKVDSIGEPAGRHHPVEPHLCAGVQTSNLGLTAELLGQRQRLPGVRGGQLLVMLAVEPGKGQRVDDGVE